MKFKVRDKPTGLYWCINKLGDADCSDNIKDAHVYDTSKSPGSMTYRERNDTFILNSRAKGDSLKSCLVLVVQHG